MVWINFGLDSCGLDICGLDEHESCQGLKEIVTSSRTHGLDQLWHGQLWVVVVWISMIMINITNLDAKTVFAWISMKESQS